MDLSWASLPPASLPPASLAVDLGGTQAVARHTAERILAHDEAGWLT